MEQIGHNIFVETAYLGSNNSMIRTDEGIVLIDAPHKPTDALKWKRQIESRGRVIYLINTDHHIDHTLTNAMLEGTIISHELSREKLAENYGGPEFVEGLLSTLDPEGIKLLPGLTTRLPTITMNDRLTLYLGEVTLELMHLKGHTRNSIMVYLPEQKILFSGDNVCSAGLPSFQEACLLSWLLTLQRILEMDIRFIVPGHGAICTKSEVERFREQIEGLMNVVKCEIEQGTPRDKIVEIIRFPDYVHTTTDAYRGYPNEMLENFQRRSIGSIYDQLTDNRS